MWSGVPSAGQPAGSAGCGKGIVKPYGPYHPASLRGRRGAAHTTTEDGDCGDSQVSARLGRPRPRGLDNHWRHAGRCPGRSASPRARWSAAAATSAAAAATSGRCPACRAGSAVGAATSASAAATSGWCPACRAGSAAAAATPASAAATSGWCPACNAGSAAGAASAFASESAATSRRSPVVSAGIPEVPLLEVAVDVEPPELVEDPE